jgi:NCS1 family nucleobase:cation symporter-1
MAEENKEFYEKNGSPASSAIEADSGAGQVSKLRGRFPGFSLEVKQEESSFAATARASNADFDPIPPSKRTWNWGAYVAYWMADAWAVSNWEVASSMISVGLDWKMAIGACVLGNTVMGLVITINGRMGATVSCVLLRKAERNLIWHSSTLRSLSSPVCHSVTFLATSSSSLVAFSLLFGSG